MVKNRRKQKIIVVGFGWVGQANAIASQLSGFETAYYDIKNPTLHFRKEYSSIYSKLTRLENMLDWDDSDVVYLICVGDRVSERGVQDISSVKNALNTLKSSRGVVVLRSTILPQHLNKLKFDYYFPEFLHEKYAVRECLDCQIFVLGKKHISKKLPAYLSFFEKRSKKRFIGIPEEASYIKYLSNTWNALRIAFVNEFGDGMIGMGKFKLEQVESVINFFFEQKAYLKYGKSFDGHCLPKDIRALKFGHKKYSDILKAMYLSNIKHFKRTRNKPVGVWYSAW